MKDCQLFSDYIITYKEKISKPQYANEIIVTDSSQMSGISGQWKYKNDSFHPGISKRGSGIIPNIIIIIIVIIITVIIIITIIIITIIIITIIIIFLIFLDASSHLYKRVCLFVCQSIGPSVRPSIHNV